MKALKFFLLIWAGFFSVLVFSADSMAKAVNSVAAYAAKINSLASHLSLGLGKSQNPAKIKAVDCVIHYSVSPAIHNLSEGKMDLRDYNVSSLLNVLDGENGYPPITFHFGPSIRSFHLIEEKSRENELAWVELHQNLVELDKLCIGRAPVRKRKTSAKTPRPNSNVHLTEDQGVSCQADLKPGFSIEADIEKSVFKLMNEARVEKGHPELEYDPVLSEKARKHSYKMARTRRSWFYPKITFHRDNWIQKRDLKKYSLRKNGENVAYNKGYGHPDITFHKRLLKSTPHRENIMDNWNSENGNQIGKVGIGVVKNRAGGYFLTELFAKPRNSKITEEDKVVGDHIAEVDHEEKVHINDEPRKSKRKARFKLFGKFRFRLKFPNLKKFFTGFKVQGGGGGRIYCRVKRPCRI